jgi:hypothetical protein
MHDPIEAAQELNRTVNELGFFGALVNDYQQAGDNNGYYYKLVSIMTKFTYVYYFITCEHRNPDILRQRSIRPILENGYGPRCSCILSP